MMFERSHTIAAAAGAAGEVQHRAIPVEIQILALPSSFLVRRRIRPFRAVELVPLRETRNTGSCYHSAVTEQLSGLTFINEQNTRYS